MTSKENADLVTTGPYSLVRHPIYSGALLAVVGSIIVLGIIWIIFFVYIFVYFIYSVKVEEEIMASKFPNEYPAYKARTKMLIPYIL